MTTAKEHPILFSGPMVRAILDGRKTQTRRVVKPQPHAGVRWDPIVVGGRHGWADGHGRHIRGPWARTRPGDRLWVREAWRPWSWHEGEPLSVEFRDGEHHECYTADPVAEQRWIEWEERLWIEVSDELNAAGVQPDEDGFYDKSAQARLRWRSPIYMPRWASRITLEVTDVRVERVQEISDEDVAAEGAIQDRGPGETWYEGKSQEIFARLWDLINGPRGYGWDANPWVWVVTLRKAS